MRGDVNVGTFVGEDVDKPAELAVAFAVFRPDEGVAGTRPAAARMDPGLACHNSDLRWRDLHGYE